MATARHLREKLEKLKKCTALYGIVPYMVTSEGFYQYIEQLESIVRFNLEPENMRLSLIYSDGRLFYDSAFSIEEHNGTHVFGSLALKNAIINGAGPEIQQLAIENHMTRPEVFESLQHISSFSVATRISSTTELSDSRRVYVANATEAELADTVCIRISMLAPSPGPDALYSLDKLTIKEKPLIVKPKVESKLEKTVSKRTIARPKPSNK